MAYKNKEDKRADDKRYRSLESSESKSRGARWNRANPDKAAANYIARTYGVSKDLAIDLYNRSIYKCDACGELWSATKHKLRFAVDHDHDTGVVRGVLCNGCNAALGLLEENEEKILSLLAYNRKHNGKV